MYVSKVNFLSPLFTSANYGHIDLIDFPNMYTHHTGEQIRFSFNWP